jgi:hypothetical protein
MRPPASGCENRTHSVKKIGPSQYSDFFNRIGQFATFGIGEKQRPLSPSDYRQVGRRPVDWAVIYIGWRRLIAALGNAAACGPPNWWTCAGLRWSSERQPCTSAGSSRARPARIRSSGTSYSARTGAQVGLRLYVRTGSALWHRWLRRMVERAGAQAKLGEAGGSKRIHTCSGMPAATRCPTKGTTRGHCRPISVTTTSSTPCGTLSCPRHALETSGGPRASASDSCAARS